MNQWNHVLNSAVNNLGLSMQVCQNMFDKTEVKEIEDRFENIVKSLCQTDNEHSATLAALQQTQEYYDNEENDLKKPIEECYEECYGEIEMEAVENHELLKKFRSGLEDIRNDNDNRRVDENADLVSTSGFVVPIDPISKTAVKNPVRNSKCGHVYEKETILTVIKKNNTRCPYIGCPNMQYVQTQDLVEDDKLRRQIERFLLKKK